MNLKNPNEGLSFDKEKLKTIYLAGGCFWGVDAYMKRVLGVFETECGYANGNTENPTYEEVCHHNTGHAETVRVVYDTSKISFTDMLGEFFGIMNPTTLNRQAGDVGDQYRSGVYYTDEADKPVVEAFIKDKQKDYKDPIVTEVEKLDNYYPAEEYHQNYLDKNPNGYCHVNLSRFRQ